MLRNFENFCSSVLSHPLSWIGWWGAFENFLKHVGDVRDKVTIIVGVEKPRTQTAWTDEGFVGGFITISQPNLIATRICPYPRINFPSEINLYFRAYTFSWSDLRKNNPAKKEKESSEKWMKYFTAYRYFVKAEKLFANLHFNLIYPRSARTSKGKEARGIAVKCLFLLRSKGEDLWEFRLVVLLHNINSKPRCGIHSHWYTVDVTKITSLYSGLTFEEIFSGVFERKVHLLQQYTTSR